MAALYLGSRAMTGLPAALDAPSTAHIAVYRTQCRLAPDEALHAWQADADWRAQLVRVDDGSPDAANELSRLDARALASAARDELHWRATHHLTHATTDFGWPRAFL